MSKLVRKIKILIYFNILNEEDKLLIRIKFTSPEFSKLLWSKSMSKAHNNKYLQRLSILTLYGKICILLVKIKKYNYILTHG